jgi:predicted metalloprotease with PDZ domain
MPAWAPGAYRIAYYARNVQAFTAVVPGGRALDWQKTDKQTWSVRKAGGEEVRVS